MGSLGFLTLILLLGLAWVALVMPRRRRLASHVAMQDSIEVDDEIITAGGIHATVVALDGDIVQAEIADGVVVRLDRRAVAAVARDVEVEVEQDAEAGSDA